MNQNIVNVAAAQIKFLFMGGVTVDGVPKIETRRMVVQLPVKIPGDGVTVGIAPKDTIRSDSKNKTRQEFPSIRRNGVALDPVDEGLMTRVL